LRRELRDAQNALEELKKQSAFWKKMTGLIYTAEIMFEYIDPFTIRE
jgi:hypothetical protein